MLSRLSLRRHCSRCLKGSINIDPGAIMMMGLSRAGGTAPAQELLAPLLLLAQEMIKIEKVGSETVSAFEVHVEKVEKRLKHWTSELDKFAQTESSILPSERKGFEGRRTNLQEKLDFANSKLEELRSAGEQKWEAFKADLELSIRQLEIAFKK